MALTKQRIKIKVNIQNTGDKTNRFWLTAGATAQDGSLGFVSSGENETVNEGKDEDTIMTLTVPLDAPRGRYDAFVRIFADTDAMANNDFLDELKFERLFDVV